MLRMKIALRSAAMARIRKLDAKPTKAQVQAIVKEEAERLKLTAEGKKLKAVDWGVLIPLIMDFIMKLLPFIFI